MQFTNKDHVPLPLAVWLAHSDYDFEADSYAISATSLLKPTRQIVLERRCTNSTADLMDMLAATYGSTLHAGIEKAWLSYKLPQTLTSIGLSPTMVEKVIINPSEPREEDINVYLEQRTEKEVKLSLSSIVWNVSGKFDIVVNGHLYDNKSTSVWTYIFKSRVDDYIKQCSIYRWLNPEIITEDFFSINYIFTDWSKTDAAKRSKDGYPQKRLMEVTYPLLSLEETEHMIKSKLEEVTKYLEIDQEYLPRCPDAELWRGDTKYKYYSDSSKITGKCTKAFNSKTEAYDYRNQKGKGIVLEILGEPKRCKYCKCYQMCTQRREYYADELEFNWS